MSQDPFKTWAIVEVMGHNEYAGFVTVETIAGAPLLRVDVPETTSRPGFTKYIAPSSLYGMTPCTEETARSRQQEKKKTPFESWSIEQQVIENLRSAGRLVDVKSLPAPDDDDMVEDEEDEIDFGDDDDDCSPRGGMDYEVGM